MGWLQTLLMDSESVAHIVLLYAFVISLGVLLGKIKFFGVSLGVTFVLFVGIIMGHWGFSGNLQILHFARELGLILFVFCIGLQVGPSFFASFKKGGVTMNLLAVAVVCLNLVVAFTLYYLLDGRIEMSMMVGILSGAITNTPSLGAAQEALHQLNAANVIKEVPQIALGYAVAYPLGVIGIIGSIIAVRFIFRVNFKNEEDGWMLSAANHQSKPHQMHLEVTNPRMFGKSMRSIMVLSGREFVISRIRKGNDIFIPENETIFEEGDLIFVVCFAADAEFVSSFIGRETVVDWQESTSPLISRDVLVTKYELNGKSLQQLNLRELYGVNVTRINRSGVELFANPSLVLNVGDHATIVGTKMAIKKVADIFGNLPRKLNEPNIATLFIGVMVGVLFGSIPFIFPGIPVPVKLGLAGGPLVISILIGRFGYKFNLVTYTTPSANLMLREIGIVLFLASVGIEAGANFFETVVNGDGLLWVICGFLITVIPLLIVGCFARGYLKMNYFMLMGLLAGSTTDPPALAYSSQASGSDAPAVGYSTIYPLVMFLRVLIAQLLILLFV